MRNYSLFHHSDLCLGNGLGDYPRPVGDLGALYCGHFVLSMAVLS